MDRRQFLSAFGAAGVGTATLSTISGSAAGSNRTFDVERRDVEVTSWDGTTIATTVFEPARPGQYPAVLATHGWGGTRDQNFGEGQDYASRGYVLMTFDSRGFGESGGEVGVDGPNEVRDVSALLDWLAAHPKVKLDGPGDPRVGMFGGSYAGGIQLNAAAADDRLDALVPEICWYDLNYALEPNGVVKNVWGLGLYGVGAAGSRQHEAESGDVTGLRHGMDPEVHRATVESIGLNGFGEGSENYFAQRSPRYRIPEIAATGAPTLLVQGWTDHLFVPNQAIWNFHGLRDAGLETKLLLYNDGHQQIPVDGEYTQAVSISDEARRAWLDSHLKDGHAAKQADARLDEILPEDVTFYSAQDETFRSVDDLPPSDADPVALQLGESETVPGASGQSLVLNGPGTSNSYVVSRSWDGPATSVDFDFPASAFGVGADQRADLLGAPKLDLRVRPLGQEAYLFVKPYHVAADGTTTHVNDLVTPQAVTAEPSEAGEFQSVSVELLAFQRYLSPGDTFRLTIAGSDTGFNVARRGAGAAISHDSTLTVPTRIVDE